MDLRCIGKVMWFLLFNNSFFVNLKYKIGKQKVQTENPKLVRCHLNSWIIVIISKFNRYLSNE